MVPHTGKVVHQGREAGILVRSAGAAQPRLVGSEHPAALLGARVYQPRHGQPPVACTARQDSSSPDVQFRRSISRAEAFSGVRFRLALEGTTKEKLAG